MCPTLLLDANRACSTDLDWRLSSERGWLKLSFFRLVGRPLPYFRSLPPRSPRELTVKPKGGGAHSLVTKARTNFCSQFSVVKPHGARNSRRNAPKRAGEDEPLQSPLSRAEAFDGLDWWATKTNSTRPVFPSFHRQQ